MSRTTPYHLRGNTHVQVWHISWCLRASVDRSSRPVGLTPPPPSSPPPPPSPSTHHLQRVLHVQGDHGGRPADQIPGTRDYCLEYMYRHRYCHVLPTLRPILGKVAGTRVRVSERIQARPGVCLRLERTRMILTHPLPPCTPAHTHTDLGHCGAREVPQPRSHVLPGCSGGDRGVRHYSRGTSLTPTDGPTRTRARALEIL